MSEVWIASGARTPIGSFNGALSSVPAPKLGAAAISEAVKRSGVDASELNEVIMGCVLSSGIGQAPARQAGIYAGIPKHVGAITINKVCGSGLKSVMLASSMIRAGDGNAYVAGGMESMSLAPYMLDKARGGYRMGHGEVKDLMIHDGLWDPYNDFHMGIAADSCGEANEISREDQDEFARISYERAVKAINEGRFKSEIIPFEVPQRKGDPLKVEADEEPSRGDPGKFSKLRAAFKKDGTVTAANASSINDGAAALVVVEAGWAKERSIKPMAKIVGYASAAVEPENFPIAPVPAIENALEKCNLKLDDIDLYELNEAFAVQALAVMKQLGLNQDKVNVNGGAVALGHPIGASGARILVTLLNAMKERDKKYGMASLCIGGGEAVALIVENV